MTTDENLKSLYDKLSSLYRLQCIGSLLGWDQQVYMPVEAAQGRADQNELISRLAHQWFTDPEFARVVDALAEEQDTLGEVDRVNVREVKRVLDIERKLPEEFVAEMAQASSVGYCIWAQARPKNDWAAVEPTLAKIVALNRRRADLVGYEEHPYDALLDIYEPGARLSQVKPLLLDLAEQLKAMIPAIAERFSAEDRLEGDFATECQQRFVARVAADLGFDFGQGRLDTTAHPFMTSIGPYDFRITTRYHEDNLLSALYGTIHETGHALYEMGLPKERAGTPMGESVSLGIHESQSRFWENLVGRSRDFCEHLLDVMKEYFPEQTRHLGCDDLWKRVNHVEPSLIRVEADEVTYSQHIVIRMLLEERLVTGDLNVPDLPAAWDDLYEEYLGIRPPDYKDGVMQDMHWYSGSIGYFPTYALGNLYGAMMMRKAREDLPEMPDQIRAGELAPMLNWLRENVHRHGMKYRAHELIRHITGRELSDKPFVEYLRGKFME